MSGARSRESSENVSESWKKISGKVLFFRYIPDLLEESFWGKYEPKVIKTQKKGTRLHGYSQKKLAIAGDRQGGGDRRPIGG